MAYSAYLTRKIFQLISGTAFKNSWRNLTLLMGFFFVGYLVAAYYVLSGHSQLLEMLTGVIFFFGAFSIFFKITNQGNDIKG